MRRLRVGLVGLGAVARAVHLPILTRRSDLYEIVAIHDLVPEIRDAVADRFGIPQSARFGDLDAMLSDADLDAAMILTSGSHAEAVVAAIDAGLAVFCEKPLAYTLREAEEIEHALDGRGDRLMVGYMKVYDPAVVRAQKLTAARPRPRSVEVNVFHPTGESQLAVSEAGTDPFPFPEAVVERLQTRSADLEAEALGAAAAELGPLYSQVLLGSLIHDMAVLRALGVGIATVDQAERWPAGEEKGSVAVAARTADDVRLALRWHYLPRYPAYREEVRWHDETGSVELVFPSPYLLRAPTLLIDRSPDGFGEDVRVHRSPVEAFEEELVAFHEMVTDGKAPRDGLAEGRADIVTCQRITQRIAATEGLAVSGEASRTCRNAGDLPDGR
jgi:myo-inositol 2-dehydrogenase / D-chiro-inositol 1-dehydrogenase